MTLPAEKSFPQEGLDRLLDYVNKIVQHCDKEIARRKDEVTEYEEIKRRLDDMPKKLSYEILVPFGKVGYMPGKLIHTNKVSVLLGDNIFAEVSCFYACKIIERRISFIQKTIDDFEAQKRLAKSRVEFGNQLFNENSDSIEIKEPYNEEAEKEWREKRQGKKISEQEKSKVSENEFEALMRRLDELEREELEGLDEEEEDEEDDSLKEGLRLDDAGDKDDNCSGLDSDDLSTPPASPVLKEQLIKEVPELKKKERRSVRFNEETSYRIIPSRFSECSETDTTVPSSVAEESSLHSILRNSEEKSPLNKELMKPEGPRIKESSGRAFSGIVYEKNFNAPLSTSENTSSSNNEERPSRMSKFKQMRKSCHRE